MAKVKKRRKLYLGGSIIGNVKGAKSRKKARSVTSEYHEIQNELEIVKNSDDISKEEKKIRRDELEKRLESIGGTHAYQLASVISTSHFKTSRWVISTIESLGLRPKAEEKNKVDVLEIGAINTQLHHCKWLNVRAIDINSQHPLIEEKNFFNLHPEKDLYDIVVCSMVVNCVADTEKRGEMLCRLKYHIKSQHDSSGKLSPSAVLLVLPLRSINSKHVGGIDSFVAFLHGVGLNEDKNLRRLTPKLVFLVLHSSGNDKKSGDWKTALKCNIKSRMDTQTKNRFTKDCGKIPAKEFCFSVRKLLNT